MRAASLGFLLSCVLAAGCGGGNTMPDAAMNCDLFAASADMCPTSGPGPGGPGSRPDLAMVVTAPDLRAQAQPDLASSDLAAPPTGTTLFDKLLPSTSIALVTGIQLDSSGNIYVCGDFAGTANFGGSDLVSLSTLGFVAAFSPTGAHLWSRSYGQGSNSFFFTALARDSVGNLYLTGSFTGTANVGATTLTSAGNEDIMVVKLSSTGEPLWAESFGSSHFDEGLGIAVDSAGNIALGGAFMDSVRFGANTLTSAGSPDALVAKLSPTGAVLWAKGFGDMLGDEAFAVAIDGNDNILAAGGFWQSANFGGGVVSVPGGGAFVVKYSPSGTFTWARVIAGTPAATGEAGASGLAMGKNGDVIVTGYYGTGTDFGGGIVPTTGMNKGAFVAEYDKNNTYKWSQGTTGTGMADAVAVNADVAGNVTLVGYLRGTVDLGGGPLVGPTGMTAGGLYAHYTAQGQLVWSKNFNGSQGGAVTFDSAHTSIIGGGLDSPVDFGLGAIGPPPKATNSGFLLKLAP